ncbi:MULTISPECIES: RNA-guided endonuclease InsQ/TnpB family protein [Nostocales]|uniref:Transposase n=2 Tax=Tolypothrix TaxID=111782 RepID=A0A0C1N6Q6_9CYAN|nr:RNA-guided endonuclease TnpB family protein [Tolypothrix bouteillei]KAF3886339.1 IS200/IS605 family element transposase accessory protein TnpB [Tolypothrix bouteillei VB521301]KAF3886365.1 IS200/IS605 family element transposase accessory protein TnpB [Tolypothrix bouteillei VB521301]
MKARYQFRFYPTDQQQQSLAQLFGCVRVVWNDALAICKQSEKLPSNNDLQKLVITQAKKTDERSWLSNVSNIPLQQSVADLGVAYKNFFDSLKGKRKGTAVATTLGTPATRCLKKVGTPKFKKKTGRQSARFRIGGFSIKGDEVYLAKIGNVKPVWSRQLPSGFASFDSTETAKTRTCSPSAPSSVTVIKDCANRYFLSFVVEIAPIQVNAKNQSIGIDLGLKTFAVMSNGEVATSPNYLKKDRKIRQLQRQLARQQSWSKRREVTRLKIAKRHNQIADTRKDFLHKLSTKVVSENQTIVLEDLNVSGMVKNRKLARAISLQGWREFRVLCEAKSEKLNREFRVISRWEPTSQTCSCCGYRWGKIDLSVRSVLCLNCGTEHDRDENACRNIEMVGMGHRHDLKRTQRQSQTTTVASVDEVSRITAPLGR